MLGQRPRGPPGKGCLLMNPGGNWKWRLSVNSPECVIGVTKLSIVPAGNIPQQTPLTRRRQWCHCQSHSEDVMTNSCQHTRLHYIVECRLSEHCNRQCPCTTITMVSSVHCSSLSERRRGIISSNIEQLTRCVSAIP